MAWEKQVKSNHIFLSIRCFHIGNWSVVLKIYVMNCSIKFSIISMVIIFVNHFQIWIFAFKIYLIVHLFLESDFRYRYIDIILASKHQILWLRLLNSLTINLFSTLITFNSSFYCLEFLSLHSFISYNSRPLLRSLLSLPRLTLLNLYFLISI